MEIEELLREEIKSELSILEEMDIGSDAYKATVDSVTKLTDRLIELKKLSVDSSDKVVEHDLKREQLDEERKDRLVRNCIAVAGIIIPSVITIWGTVKSFEFEKEGTITTSIGRGFINKLLPRK